MGRTEHNSLKQRRASQAAMLVAAASVPNTFQRTLMPRKTKDQGIATGATMAINYFIVSTLRKLMEDAADGMAGTKNARDRNRRAHKRQQRFAFGLDLASLAAGIYGQKRFDQKTDEPDSRGMLRTLSAWLTYSAIAGVSITALDESFGDKKSQKLPARYKTPWGIIGGGAFSFYSEFRRRQALKRETTQAENQTNTIEAVGMGAGVLAVLAAINSTERLFAEGFSKQISKVLPGSEDFFWSLGHSAAIAGTGAALASFIKRIYRQIEEGAAKIEPAYLSAPESEFVSGGPGSLVGWQSLSIEGRRFAASVTTADNIQKVMGGQALSPIRAYAGLDSAPTEVERLDLLLKELERTNAYSRGIIMLVSPTGTGYVNYVAVEAAEYMSGGSIATAALQYSKRPSPMSLDKVPEGNLQFRMMVKAVSHRVAKLPAAGRPKLVIFGESLGAWTSQDAFIDQGTDGLEFAGVQNALWIGTPYGSKWKNQVLGKTRPDVDKNLIGKFDNVQDFLSTPPEERQKFKYIMLTHHNDPVALFNLGLIIHEPDWLKDPNKRPPTIPRSQYYTSPGTFLLTLIDMGNAMNVVPGKFEASGHDYRANLAEFVRYAYDFDVSDEQMKNIEDALRQNELNRASILERAKQGAK
jgi:uncharacterized membrane protein